MGHTVKVAHVATVDTSVRYLLLNQLSALRDAGYEVVAISSAGPHSAAVEGAGIRHIPVPMTRRVTPIADLVSLWRLFRVIRKERFTIVHTHNPKPGLLGQLAARLARVPIVVNTLHGFYFHDHTTPALRRLFIATEKVAARCSDVILSQNSEDVSTAIREGICRPDRIKHLGNGIDLQRFDRGNIDPQVLAERRRELGLPEGHPVVGFVGRLVAEKGIHELLQSARQVLDSMPGTRFLLVGPLDPEKRDAVTPEIVNGYGLGEACTFAGMRQDMPEMYALMDVFVLPSHREGFPRSPMEASAMGIPCVVTDVRGCREAVQHGGNGLLVPLGDVRALADAIVSLLSKPEEARRMGEVGRQIALERFDERIVFEKVKAEYARLLRERGLPAPAP